MRTISVGTVCINISQIAANIDINLEVRLNSKKKKLFRFRVVKRLAKVDMAASLHSSISGNTKCLREGS